MCVNYSSSLSSARPLRRKGCSTFSPNRHILFIKWNEIDLRKRHFLKERSRGIYCFYLFSCILISLLPWGQTLYPPPLTPFDNYLWNQTITKPISLAIDQGLKFKQVYMTSRSGELSSWGAWGEGTGSISCEMSAVKIAFEPRHTQGSRCVSKFQQKNALVDVTGKWNSKGRTQDLEHGKVEE